VQRQNCAGQRLYARENFIGKGFCKKIPKISFYQRAARVLLSALRQGPWMEGWRTPPEPEGSNGSLPFLVVVP